jgi:FkbM family methyltransferase
MSKLTTIWRTLTIPQNPLEALSLKRGSSRKLVSFRNGSTYCLNWPQFRVFRDNYQFLIEYAVTQVKDDLFKVDDARSEVVCASGLLPMLFDLMRDFAIHQEKGEFHLNSEKLEFVGSYGMLVCLQELKTGEYECDCRGKVVLDVGGFEGESAVYFWGKGAKKIIVYEPVTAHIESIQKNVALNHIDAEIHLSGIGSQNGIQTINFNETDPGFGILSKGAKSIEIKITDVSKVIEESGAEIGKFDCEGAEISLVSVPAEILRKIAYYIIEAHSREIRNAVLEKFVGSGFTLEKEISKPGQFSVLVFKRGAVPKI